MNSARTFHIHHFNPQAIYQQLVKLLIHHYWNQTLVQTSVWSWGKTVYLVAFWSMNISKKSEIFFVSGEAKMHPKNQVLPITLASVWVDFSKIELFHCSFIVKILKLVYCKAFLLIPEKQNWKKKRSIFLWSKLSSSTDHKIIGLFW